MAKRARVFILIFMSFFCVALYYQHKNVNKYVKKPTADLKEKRPRKLVDIQTKCLVQYLGCVCKKKDGKLFDEESEQIYASKENCFHFCSKTGNTLAVTDDVTCFCGNRFSSAPTATSNNCERKTIQYHEDNCSATNLSYELYLIRRPCTGALSAITESYISDRFYGIYEKPINFTQATYYPLSYPHMTSLYCYRHCENNEQKLAMLLGDECRCGYTHENFKLNKRISPNISDATARSPPTSLAVWITDAPDYRCLSRKFLPRNTVEPIGLVSYPGSGNTWLRYLIECATGYFSGSVYDDASLQAQGYLGEFDDMHEGRTIIIKDHTGSKISSFCKKTVLLIRNPYDALIAQFNRMGTKSHTGVRNLTDFQSKQWDFFIKYDAFNWLSSNLKVLGDARTSVHVVYYEELVEDYLTEIRNIVNFMGYQVNETRLHCLKDSGAGLFKRKKTTENFYPFPEEKIRVIGGFIAMLRFKLKHYSEKVLPDYRTKNIKGK